LRVVAFLVAALPRRGRELEQLRRADDAADMGGEDAVLAAFHCVPVSGLTAAISVPADRIVNAGKRMERDPKRRTGFLSCTCPCRKTGPTCPGPGAGGQGLCAGAAM